jgi:NTE family protein
MSEGRRVALALGSGGARGYAHIGTIQVLEERGYEIVAVAGTSMGAVIGGLYAAGRLDTYVEWVTSLSQRDVWRLLDPVVNGPGAIRAERVMGRVAEILDGALIEDLAIPFTAVATDLDLRREVWFQRGPVHTAMRASVAIPSVITPIVVDGRVLVDGGLINPVPIEPTTAVASDLTVAVSLCGLRAESGGAGASSLSPVRPAGTSFQELTDRVRALSTRLTAPAGDKAAVNQPPAPSAPYSAPPKDLTTVDVIGRSLDTMEALIARYRMASNPPDVLVSVPADACRTMDYHRAQEMIDLGRALTMQALDAAGR